MVIDDDLDELGKLLAACGMAPNGADYTDAEVVHELTEYLGAEPAAEIASWFRFSSLWEHCIVAPDLMGVIGINGMGDGQGNLASPYTYGPAVVEREAGAQHGPADIIALGVRPDGSYYIASPAVAAGANYEPPRVCCWDFGETFFFPSNQDRSVDDRAALPKLDDWVGELVTAHRSGRIVSDGQSGFVMADGFAPMQGYPWKASLR